ncbi:TlpA disulfide reductase family protein [uncultured Paraglaciecola sp.]|uniref:TlpA family protein disulfide reductase n=1 Tax=uncultured Paraglaciecola sp. TaxID=1765024 RepID=UPI0030D9E90C|tara:strand:+ start:123125 stop:123604 length:480 start_codon:yes stop_codon:yes gene_type:complete
MRFKCFYFGLLFFSLGIQAEQIQAKNFSLHDIQNNRVITLNDYHGKVIYLDFWASWCSSCAKALPLFKKWHQELGDDFVVVSVNVDEDKADGLLMAQKFQLDFPIGYDENLDVAKMYGASVLPFSFIINQDGDIHYRHVGFQDTDAVKLKTIIQKLLSK